MILTGQQSHALAEFADMATVEVYHDYEKDFQAAYAMKPSKLNVKRDDAVCVTIGTDGTLLDLTEDQFDSKHLFS